MNEKELAKIADILRIDSMDMTSAAGSGHPSSCLSCAEIMSVLFFDEMRYDIKNPDNKENDEFILSKGHAAPILYSCLQNAGCINDDLLTLRKIDSALEGHAMPRSLSWIKAGTGSLGQGLSVGVGMAMAGKLSKRDYRTYVLIGDSEMAEGSNYEALQLASYYRLNNLCAIIDVNKLGQRGETMLGHDVKKYKERIESFGWKAIIVDGHNLKQLKKAFEIFHKSKQPTCIIAKTIKGKGVSFIEGKNGWHGKALNEEELKKAFKNYKDEELPDIKIIALLEKKYIEKEIRISEGCNYNKGDNVATREAYGKAVSELAKMNEKIICLDAEVSNSTYADEVKKSKPKQFVECFIAEQNMIGMAEGLSKKDFNIYASTFGAFLTRAHDQIRMAALSSANMTICGSHAGVSIGEDGASQMALEDISMMRAIPESIVFYPSDAACTEKLVFLSSQLPGIKYIRTTRPKTAVLYDANEKFDVGDYKVNRESKNDKIVLVGSGITLHETLKAYEKLLKDKINCAVIDLYCVKPFNGKKFIDFVKKHGNKIVVSEDHFAEGGIGEMLKSELANTDIKIIHLAVKEIPHSGTKDELLDKYGINAKAIEEEARKLLG